MRVEVQAGAPADFDAAVVAVLLSADGLTEPARAVDASLDGLLAQLAQDGELRSDLGSARLVHVAGGSSPRRVVVAGAGEADRLDADGLRTAASAVVSEAGGFVDSIAWPIDPALPLSPDEQA